MVPAIFNVALTPSFIAVSTGLIISAIIVMMVRPSNPDMRTCSDLNLDHSLSIDIRECKKHTCNSQNQPDFLFHRYHPVKFYCQILRELNQPLQPDTMPNGYWKNFSNYHTLIAYSTQIMHWNKQSSKPGSAPIFSPFLQGKIALHHQPLIFYCFALKRDRTKSVNGRSLNSLLIIYYFRRNDLHSALMFLPFF